MGLVKPYTRAEAFAAAWAHLDAEDARERARLAALRAAQQAPAPPPPPKEESAPPKPKQMRHAPHSKKHTVGKLQADWRERVFEGTASSRKKPSKLRCATAVLWATGCRPSEIEIGVEVELRGGLITIRIPGSKHGEIDNGTVVAMRGMEWREIDLRPGLHAGTAFLAELAKDGPVLVQAGADGLGTDLRKVGRAVLPRKMIAHPEDPRPGGKLSMPKVELTVSPYCFRQAMGCDVKSCDGMTDVEKSQIMGHLNTDSLAHYGKRRRGGGGQRPVEAVRSSAVPSARPNAPAEHQAADRPRG